MLNVLAAVAETARDPLVKRTQSGLARAKAEGRTWGRPTSMRGDGQTIGYKLFPSYFNNFKYIFYTKLSINI